MENTPAWAAELDCAVTVCNVEGIVVYQNAHSCEVNGDVRGKSLISCHNDHSRSIIRRLIDEGGTNVYTIEKGGVHKMIYQTAWRVEGQMRGLVEFSMEIPAQMPHHIRG